MQGLPRGVRFALFVGINGALLLTIGVAFWFQDWQYALPTPRPDGLFQPALGSRPELPAALQSLRNPGRPLLVHFASAQCPCTEFNLDHVRTFQKNFGGRVDFVVVLQTNSAPEEATREFDGLHLSMSRVVDRDGQTAAALGVYGTPQAALLDADGHLFYRGNYNRSRYCQDESSEFVRIALSALVSGRVLPNLPQQAFVTFGCPLPRSLARRPGEGS